MEQKVHIPSRIEAMLLEPLAIDLAWGFRVYNRYMDQMALAASGSSLPTEMYRRAREENAMQLFCADNFANPSFRNITNTEGAKEARTIAQINLKGPMLTEGDICTPGADFIVDQLQKANENPNVIGAVLNTNSGGGEVSAAQRISNALKEFSKPIVTYVDAGMAASGAYWTAAHTDAIVLGGQTASVGSIGVVIQFDRRGVEEMSENLVSIFSEGSDRKQDVFQAILKGDYDFVRSESLNPLRAEFVRIVKKGRPEISEEIFDGRMMTGRKAKSAGMVDSIGTRRTALNKVMSIIRARNAANALKSIKS